jgi:formylglycine-generating enzyme required for sulfatase activity
MVKIFNLFDRPHLIVSYIIFFIYAPLAYANTAPVVTNVQAAQRDDGSMLVDIFYDLYDADGNEMTVSMQASDDGGATWNFTCQMTLPGSDIGSGILSGTGKHIVWDVAAEYPGIYNEEFQFKIIADDEQTGSIDAEWCLITASNYTYGQDNTILNIPYDYEIMKYVVTNAQYLAYLQEAYAVGDVWVSGSEVQGYYPGDQHWGAGNRQLYSLGTPSGSYKFARISFSNGEFILNAPSGFTVDDYLNHPVVRITWFGAWHFADYYGWRLPTEHEWEKAARGMTGYDYPWGDTIDGSQANYWESGDPWDNGTTPVDFYNGQIYQGFQTTDSPSPFGVYDMSGNARNWTDSFWSSTISNRVVRGSSGNLFTSDLQTWSRNYSSPTYDGMVIGFRCVRTLD